MADTLYALDGYGLIYRSYFAFVRNPMRNPRGENASAVFGFVRTLVALFRDYSPRAFVIALDPMGPTFRHERFPDYKGTRDRTPDDLHAQIPVIEAIIDALGVPVIRVDRYEADDVLATLAMRCRAEGRGCRLITADKDLVQLVGDGVDVLRPGSSGIEAMGEADVVEKWGVRPDQILDYLSLVGDSSDNVPGVAGIGAKTAASLLGTFGTLDAIYDRLDEISSASQRTKLEAGREMAYLGRELITLRSDVPLPLELADLAITTPDYGRAAPLLLEQGMRRLLSDLGIVTDDVPSTGATAPTPARGDDAPPDASDGAPAGTPAPLSPLTPAPDRIFAVTTAEERARLSAAGTYTTVRDLDTLQRWVDAAAAAGRYAFDCETDSLDAVTARPVGFSLALEVGRACYIPLVGPDGPVLPEDGVREIIAPLLTDPTIEIVGQNLKYDWQVLAGWGIDIPKIHHDTMIAAWLIDTSEGSYGMDRLAKAYLGYTTTHFADLFPDATVRGGRIEGARFADVDLDRATHYAAEDADITLRLWVVLDRLLDLRGVRDLYTNVEMPLVRILAAIERAGIVLDGDALARYGEDLALEIAAVEAEIFDLVGHPFSIASTKQLQAVLFDERGLQPIKKTKTGYSTDNGVLQELAREDPLPSRILRYRQLTKLKSTYVDALPRMINAETGRVHTSFNQTGTATGRLSSTDPNLQNIPIRDEEGRRIRRAFVSAPGTRFVSADYAQVELVILAHLSGDAALREAFAAGEDVHRRTAALIFGVDPSEVTSDQRRAAKTINFGVMYGMSAFRLAGELGIPRREAEAFIEAYFATYSGIRRFIDDVVATAERDGEVRTLLGRPRPLPDITNRNRTVKAGAERVAVNTPIQGTGADIVKRAMIRVAERLTREAIDGRIILQVHDELILEVADGDVARARTCLLEEMGAAVELSIPLRVSVEDGARWGDLHG